LKRKRCEKDSEQTGESIALFWKYLMGQCSASEENGEEKARGGL
jgi:hypothetical protein